MRAFADFYQMPNFMFDHFALVKTNAKANLRVSSGQTSYPVVIFSHGAGTGFEVSTSQSQDLASYGYVVADVDHPYVSAATVFLQQIVTAHEATTNFDTPEPAEPITQIMAQDDQFVITALGSINQTDPAFKGKLDLKSIGVMGHSVGGAVAYNLAINNPRVHAAINLDGSVYIKPKNNTAIAPFLMLANEQYHVQAIKARESLVQKFDSTPEGLKAMLEIYGSKRTYEAAYKNAQENMEGLADVLQRSGNLYTITGSDHMKLTDIGLFFGSEWLRELLQIRGRTDPSRCLEITEALTVAFFDRHLKHQSARTLTKLLEIYPELRKVDLN
jgi:dienelactone hydrolase